MELRTGLLTVFVFARVFFMTIRDRFYPKTIGEIPTATSTTIGIGPRALNLIFHLRVAAKQRHRFYFNALGILRMRQRPTTTCDDRVI